MSRAQLTSTVEQNTGGAVSPYVAGKNKIINGDFGIWQRGTSFAGINGGVYTADRWAHGQDGTGSITYSQQTFTPGTAPVAGYEGTYFLRTTVTATGTATYTQVEQRLEDARLFAGQTATVSFWAKADSARSNILAVVQSFGTGGSSGVVVATPTINYTTSWQRFSFTFSVPSVAGKTIGSGSYLSIGIRSPLASGSVVDIWGVQIETGSVATPFTTATGTLSGELAACQRYYPVIPAGSVLMGYAYATNGAILNYTLPVTPRVAPTGITTTAMATFDGYNAANTSSTPSSITTNSLGQWGGALLSAFTCTAATPVRLVLTTGTIGFTGCEL